MRSAPRTLKLALGLLTGLAVLLVGSPPAAAATASATVVTASATVATDSAPASVAATWTLVDYNQTICVDSRYGRRTYFLIFISGTWSAPIEFGLRDMPPGGSSSPSAPIPPGSSGGGNALNGMLISIPPTPVGVYVAKMWASDGTETQTVSLTFRVQEGC